MKQKLSADIAQSNILELEQNQNEIWCFVPICCFSSQYALFFWEGYMIGVFLKEIHKEEKNYYFDKP